MRAAGVACGHTCVVQDRELSKQRRMMDVVGDHLRNYTCADPEMNTTKPALRTFEWEDHSVSAATGDACVCLWTSAAHTVLLRSCKSR
jgi:hypothetical protein